MLELVKGKLENLEGRAYVFSRLMNTNHRCGFYTTRSSEDALEKMGLPKIGLKNPVGENGFAIIEFEPTDLQLAKADYDVLYAGDHEVRDLGSAVNLAIEFYQEKYKDQLYGTYGDIRTFDRLGDIPIAAVILDKFVVPMIEAKRNDDAANFMYTQVQFQRFMEGSHFMREMTDLIANIALYGGAVSPTVILTNVRKIAAVYHEDYDVAAEMRDRIREMPELVSGIDFFG